jgi:hypothetical protein
MPLKFPEPLADSCGMRPTTPDTKSTAKINFLNQEMDEIHYANSLYWKQEGHSKAAKAQYQWRQDRLEEIRKELDQLRAIPPD